MGLIHEPVGNFSIEKRRESFIIHPNYGYDDSLGSFGVRWRENSHPEFLLEDLPDLLEALQIFRDLHKEN